MISETNKNVYSLKRAAKSVIHIVHDPFKVVSDGNLAVLRSMLNDTENPLNVNKSRWSGFSLLHRAASQGHTDICQVLIEAGANINQRSVWGWYTPLHLALANGWVDTAEFFVLAGADLRALSKSKEDACDYAIKRGYKQLGLEFRGTMLKLEAGMRTRNRKAKQQALSKQKAFLEHDASGLEAETVEKVPAGAWPGW
jgi:hypothetical protein